MSWRVNNFSCRSGLAPTPYDLNWPGNVFGRAGNTLHRKGVSGFCLQTLLALCLETRTPASWCAILFWKWDCFPSAVHIFRKALVLIVFSRMTYSSMKQETMSSLISGIRLWTLEHQFSILLPNVLHRTADTFLWTFREKLSSLLTMWLPWASMCPGEKPELNALGLGNVNPIFKGSRLSLSVAWAPLTQMLSPVP